MKPSEQAMHKKYLGPGPYGPGGYAIAPFVCPRCEKPSERLVAGVCEHCKKDLEAQHRKDGKEKPQFGNVAKAGANHGTYFDDDGNRVRTTADSKDGENLIHAVCAEFGFNFALAMEVTAFVQQHSASPHNSVAEQRFLEWLERDKAATARGLNYPGDVRMYLRMMALRKGYYDIAGGDGVVGVAAHCGTKKHAVGKATAEKCFSVVEAAMNLPQYPPMPRLPNQRTTEQKEKMRQAQKNIWHKPDGKKSKTLKKTKS